MTAYDVDLDELRAAVAGLAAAIVAGLLRSL